MVFHTLGDSHCHRPWEKVPGVKFHHFGAALAYTVAKHKHDLVNGVNIRNDGIEPGDVACFCFGEIDCRCHVHKHVTPDMPYQKVIDGIVNDMIIALMDNEKIIPGVRMAMLAVVPPPRAAGVYVDPGYPFIGSDDERLSYVRYWNSLLEWNCKELGWLFVNVYDKYADADGFLNHTYSDDHVHIKDPCFYVEFLKAHNLL